MLISNSGVIVDALSAHKRALNEKGFMIVPASECVHYTAGMCLSKCHPELLFDGVDADSAKAVFTAMADHIDQGVRYRPGLYEILGREIQISAMPRNLLQHWLPVAWRLLNSEISALRLQFNAARV